MSLMQLLFIELQEYKEKVPVNPSATKTQKLIQLKKEKEK